MGELLPFIVLAGTFAATIRGLVWLASRVRRRGAGGAVMAVVDDVFHPTAHQSYFEIRAQDERKTPIQAPGDPWDDDK